MSSAIARNKIRDSLREGLLAITTTNGYRNTIRNAYDPPRDYSMMTDYPSVNILWGAEDRTNAGEFGGAIAGNRPLMSLKWDVELDFFIMSHDDPQGAADSLIADVGEYFGNNYYVQGSDNQRTAFIITYNGTSAVQGTELEKPKAWFTMRFAIYYRVGWQDFSTLA